MGRIGRLASSRAARRWLKAVESAPCVPMAPPEVIREADTGLTDGHVLEPDAVHEARLVPLLFSEEFSEHLSSGWTEADGSWDIHGHKTIAGGEIVFTGAREVTVTASETVDSAALSPHAETLLVYPSDGEPRQYVVEAINAGDANDRLVLTLDADPDLTDLRNDADGPVWELIEGWAAETGSGRSLLRLDSRSDASGDAPSDWTDYFASATVTPTASGGRVGLAVRVTNGDGYALVLPSRLPNSGDSMDRATHYSWKETTRAMLWINHSTSRLKSLAGRFVSTSTPRRPWSPRTPSRTTRRRVPSACSLTVAPEIGGCGRGPPRGWAGRLFLRLHHLAVRPSDPPTA